ncbi:MAG TPA: hypothetical protein VG963_26210 [Polyangiaceae bacterium]|nr:hypothetical protein [Polyangiaceae bacterium]
MFLVGASWSCSSSSKAPATAPDRQQPYASVSTSGDGQHLCGGTGETPGLLEIRDQPGLDALAGCERITGDLSLWLFPGADETPLLSLTSVDGALFITGDGDVEDPIGGLRALEEVRDLNLYNLTLPSLEPLGHLRVVSDGASPGEPSRGEFAPSDSRGLTIVQCSGLESLAGLDALEQAPRVVVQDDPDLKSIAGLSSSTALREFDIADCPLLDLEGLPSVQTLYISSSALVDLSGLEAPELETLTLWFNAQLLTMEGAHLPEHLARVELVDNGALENLRGLDDLRSLDALQISSPGGWPSSLQSLDGLQGIKDMGSLDLEGQTQLANMTGLSLESLQGLMITGCSALESLSGLSEPTSSSAQNQLGGLTILGPSPLTSLEGLPPLAAGTGLTLADLPQLADLQGLSALGTLSSISVLRTGLRDLDALGSMKGSELSIIDNWNLRSLPQVDLVGTPLEVEIVNSPALQNWTGSRFQVAYEVTIGNTGLANLDWLSDLLDVGQLKISSNPNLTVLELPALKQATSIDIHGNLKLDDTQLAMDLDGLQQLSREGKEDHVVSPVTIGGNLGSTAALDPCPWQGDKVCDEQSGACAAGADASDCSH